jgi:hypothetical protein
VARSVDPARAEAALDTLLGKFEDEVLAASLIRDSALSIYNGAYARLDDRAAALRWARLAVQHDPNVRAYTQLVSSLSQP